MRRAIARGRIVPQSLSTDPRMGRLSLKAALLFPLMWINCDDQGRLPGDSDEIKYATCPNIDHITKLDIPELLKELEEQGFLKLYTTSNTKAIQMLDWWEEQRLQWAWPSRYPPPEGWQDRLRFKPTPQEIVTENWLPPSRLGSESPSALPSQPPSQLASNSPSAPPSALQSNRESSKEIIEEEKEKDKENERGRGNIGGAPPGIPSPSLTVGLNEILRELTQCFKIEWGKVPVEEPHKVIPREPNARESAQLRDLAKNLSAGGGVPLDFIKQAFREAAGHNKMYISYVRKILLAWLGRESP